MDVPEKPDRPNQRRSAEWWREISAYLDHALTLPHEDRAAWLQSLRNYDPATAARLQDLLDEYDLLARSSYLEDSPDRFFGRSELPGQTIGAYKLISLLGEGGM